MHFVRKYGLKKYLATIFLLCFFSFQAFCQWDKDVFSWRGRKALSEGKYSTAIENFNIIARLDTADYWNYFFRGIAKYSLGDLRGALKDFDRSVYLNPVFTNGYHYRAITYSRFGRYDEAFADFGKALELRPGSEAIYYSRGVTYFMCQQFDKAVKDFNKYVRKQPKDPSAYLNRGACFLYMADTTAALADYDKAIYLDRFEPEGFIRRGRLYASGGKMLEGIEDMNHAIELEPDNSFALFNRGIMLFDTNDYVNAMNDFDKVLELEPGNALTLYNRGLIKAQLGDFDGALSDLDRVVNINPGNVLVYFNRAAIYIEIGNYLDALEDYNKAIALYPDFAKAYLNRSYVKTMLGRTKGAKEDYNIAQRKIAEYRAKNIKDAGSFADTTKKYSSLIALDADFAKKDFNDEILQYRDIDMNLRPLYKFTAASGSSTKMALQSRYENPAVDRFIGTSPQPIKISNAQADSAKMSSVKVADARTAFLKALSDCQNHQFSSALANYNMAINEASVIGQDAVYQAFYYMNRGVLRAEMIEFIASIDNSSQVLSMDDNGKTRAKVKDKVNKKYDYSEAVADMARAAEIAPTVAYIQYNLGNLYCLSSDHIASISAYTRAISLYPQFGEAYFNRALVLIYLKEKEKGCTDLSTAGQLGVKDAYGIIKKYCEDKR